MKFAKYLRIAVSIALLGFLAWQTDWASFAGAMQKLRVEFWLVSVGLLCVAQVVSAVRWQMLARALGFEASVRRLTAFYFIGMYFNLLLPTSVGGDVVRAWYLNAASGRSLLAFLAVLFDRISGLIVLLSLACLAVTCAPLEMPAWIGHSVWGMACAALAGLSVVVLFAQREGESKRAQQTRAALSILRRPRLLLMTTLLSLFVQVANIVIVMVVGFALALDVPGSFYWILVPMVTLLTLLPISVNGMGVREGATALMLAPFGVNQASALSLALAWFAVHAVASLLGGVVYMFGRFPKPAVSETSIKGPDRHGSVDHHSDQGRTREHQAAA